MRGTGVSSLPNQHYPVIAGVQRQEAGHRPSVYIQEGFPARAGDSGRMLSHGGLIRTLLIGYPLGDYTGSLASTPGWS